jgi:hypothetical protein
MLRRLMLSALALCALLALESCGVDRIAGPQVGSEDSSTQKRSAHYPGRVYTLGHDTLPHRIPTPVDMPDSLWAGDPEL